MNVGDCKFGLFLELRGEKFIARPNEGGRLQVWFIFRMAWEKFIARPNENGRLQVRINAYSVVRIQ